MEQKNVPLLKIIRDVFGLFTKKERRKFSVLFLLAIGNALCEIMSVSAVFPIIKILFNPEKAATYPILNKIYALPFVHNNAIFAITVSVFTVLIFLLKGVYELSYTYLQGSALKKVQTKYSLMLYQYYINRPYEFFFKVNTNELHRKVFQVVQNLLSSVVASSMRLFTHSVTILFLLITILFTGTIPVLASSAVLLALCSFLYFNTQAKAKDISIASNTVSGALNKSLQEYLRGVKALRILGREQHATDSAEELYNKSNSLKIKSDLMLQLPKHVLEVGTISVMLFILVYTYISDGNIGNGLAIISVCGVAVFRLRAELTDFLSSSIAIRKSVGPYLSVYEDLKNAVAYVEPETSSEPLSFHDRISIDAVSYTYPGTKAPVLESASAEIYAKEFVGIMGPSGEGKSTFADILMGLLPPSEGQITIDGVPLVGNEKRFQKIVGYVPQTIFMMDSSIAENVALAILPDQIDREKVEECLRIAQLYDFVQTLPNGIDSKIGDKGIRISGGQRQRIGIARALYSDPQILLFDEATSALDAETEQKFIDTVYSLSEDFTVIFIAHRTETLKYCGRILRISNGKIVGPDVPSI